MARGAGTIAQASAAMVSARRQRGWQRASPTWRAPRQTPATFAPSTHPHDERSGVAELEWVGRLPPDARADGVPAGPAAEPVRGVPAALAVRAGVVERSPTSALAALQHQHEAACRDALPARAQAATKADAAGAEETRPRRVDGARRGDAHGDGAGGAERAPRAGEHKSERAARACRQADREAPALIGPDRAYGLRVRTMAADGRRDSDRLG